MPHLQSITQPIFLKAMKDENTKLILVLILEYFLQNLRECLVLFSCPYD